MEEGFCAAECGKNVEKDYFSDPIWEDEEKVVYETKSGIAIPKLLLKLKFHSDIF